MVLEKGKCFFKLVTVIVSVIGGTNFLFEQSYTLVAVVVQVSGFAFAGYAAGIAAYLAMHNLDVILPTTVAHLPFLSGS